MVDLQDVIVVGHTRLMAAKKLGMAQVPVHVAANLTPAQAKAYRLMDNRSSQETSFDLDMLSAELLDLKGLNIDLALTGFDYGELDALLGTDGQSAGDGASAAKARATLAERFGVPPFSVLDARQGYWQDRKRAWLALGIQSELGRGDAIPGGGGPETESAWLRGGHSNSKISREKPLIANGGGMNSKRRYDRANGGATAEL